MQRRFAIQVRKDTGKSWEPGEVICTIKRVLRSEQIGNFNPVFCRYNGNPRVLVKSLDGDLSDPFRRTPAYADSLYIVV